MWTLTLVPGRETLNPWNFLSDRSVFVIPNPLASHLWLGLDMLKDELIQDGVITRKTKHVNRDWGF